MVENERQIPQSHAWFSLQDLEQITCEIMDLSGCPLYCPATIPSA